VGGLLELREMQLEVERLKAENRRLRDELSQWTGGRDETLRLVLDAAPFAVFVEKLDGSIVDCNSAACSMTGYSRKELLNMGAKDLVPPAVARRFPDLIEEEMTTGGFFVESMNLRKGGEPFPVEAASKVIHLQGEPHIIVVVHDITRRKLSEDALVAEKKRLAVTLASIGDGVIATDTSGRVVLMNKVAEELCGWSSQEALGRPLPEVFQIVSEYTGHPAANPVEKVLKSGQVVGMANHTILISRQGRRLPIADSGAPINDRDGVTLGIVLVFRDQSQERNVELELRRAQRMESVGTLAGGMAHDFNNVLTAVMGNISMALRPALPRTRIEDYLAKAERACVRARELTQSLLTFARGGTMKRRSISLKEAVEEAASMAITGSRVSFEALWPEAAPNVLADPLHLSQVVNNIVLNAVQAMPEGGKVTAETALLTLFEENQWSLPAGDYVQLTLSDDGPGIPADVLPRVFDPYFSTKEAGTGLGLASSYSIMRAHHGSISVKSVLGSGAQFTLVLPRSDSEVGVGLDEESGELAVPRRRVLLLDGDSMVRSIGAEMLDELGYSATAVSTPEAALARCREANSEGAPFDAVILSGDAGTGGGKLILGEIISLMPEVFSVVTCNYALDPLISSFRDYGFRSVLTKPFRMAELRQILSGMELSVV